MAAEKKGRSNTGILLMLAVMFLVMGFILSRGFLALGFIFLIITLTSIGRRRAHDFAAGDQGEEGESGDPGR